MTRIKYSRYNDLLITEFIIVGPNQIIRGVITPEFQYIIQSFDGDILSSSQASNLRNAKLNIRKLLKQFGAKLEDEIRQTTP